ncbi:hypothetical protein [Pseudomonas sp. EpS/L25]|uniref:hypothetical protein n=1 Tax=Pseudomonas sp. EpS/L25 TaxID=1749078 RepID=UPI00074432DC|nr:hypothetical protein [Pseudomonas sp. EpS/L25]KUM43924.1 hypothetical protein AR540_19325 [Pseudomonas sp. EpS/L25]
MKNDRWLNIPLGPSRSSYFGSTAFYVLLGSAVILWPKTLEAWLYLLFVGLPLTWLVLGNFLGLDDWQRRCRYSFAPLMIWVVRVLLIVAIFKAEPLMRPGFTWLWQQGSAWLSAFR